MDSITEDYRACICGDKEATIRLYLSMKDILLNTAMGVVNDHSIAEDVVHDVFLQLIQSYENTDVKNAKLYMIRMTRNRAIDYVRKDCRLVLVEENSELLAKKEEYEEPNNVSALLNQLPQEEAETVRLRVVGELRYQEIAGIMGVSVTKAFRLYRRGISRLQKLVKKAEGDDRR